LFFYRTDSIEKLRAKRPEFEQVFRDPEQFKDMYKYTFTFAKNRGQKCMEIEVICPSMLKKKRPFADDFDRRLKYYGACYLAVSSQ
jgi:hypothetical protein